MRVSGKAAIGPRLLEWKDPDVAAALLELMTDEGV
jgi:hypothetical protein